MLLPFQAHTFFAKPSQSSQNNSFSLIINKVNINYITNTPDQASIPCYRQHYYNSSYELLSMAITAKFNDGNKKSAQRLLLSDGYLAKNNDATYKIARKLSCSCEKPMTTTCTITLGYMFASIGTMG